MKKTQIKDTLRNIWKEKISFISIAIIALLAVAAYLGINFTSEAIRLNADNFYQDTNFRDLEITSTMMLGAEDLDSLSDLPEVVDVEGVYVATGKVPKGLGHENVNIVSVTERLNTMQVAYGRLPENEKECAVESDLATITGVKVGETLIVTNAKGDCPDNLKENSFVITGIIYHSDLLPHKNQTPGNRYVMVVPEVFDKEALKGSYMKALIRINKPEGISYYSKEYKEMSLSVKESVEEWSKGREENRREKFQEILREKLDEPRQELADAEKELKEAKATLDEKKKEIEDAEKALAEGKTKLDDAAKELADGEEELKKGNQELADAKTKLDEAKAELDKGEAELSSAKAELDKSWGDLSAAKSQLEGSRAQLVDAYNSAESLKEGARALLKGILQAAVKDVDFNSGNWAQPNYINDINNEALSISTFYAFNNQSPISRSALSSGSAYVLVNAMLSGSEYEQYFPVIRAYVNQSEDFRFIAENMASLTFNEDDWEAGKMQYIKGVGEYNEAYSKYESALGQYNEGLGEYNTGLANYTDGLAAYDTNKKKLDDGWEELNSGKTEYEKNKKEYESKVKKLEDGKSALKDGEEEYAEAKSEFEDAEEELRKAEERLSDLSQCRFLTLDTSGNAGFVYADDSANNMAKLGKTFALLFVILGALVIYATVGRIIDEQRTQVGTQKALGFFSSEVFKKHLAFGVVATSIGIILGVVFGYLLVQGVVLKANEGFFVMDRIPLIIRWDMVGIILVLGIILSGFAVFWACSHLLKETAKSLMQPAAPKGRKKTEKKKRRGSLYSRLIIRNMLTDWKRVLITMASVAGCCVLLVIGFTLKNSIINSVEYQFDNIIKYKDKISYDVDSFKKSEEEIEKTLESSNIEYMKFYSGYHSMDSPEGMTAIELLAVDEEELEKYFIARDINTKEILVPPKEGIIITRRISEVYDLSMGDTVTIYNSNMEPYETKVSGIFEYYVGKIIFISKDAYKNLFGEEVVDNTFWTKGDYSSESLQDELAKIKGFEALDSVPKERARYMDSTASLQSITFLLILAAGMMAYFVLLNLINMYLNQKKKELTIMRVNGFTTKEVIRYVAGESVLTTCLGIILGLLLGSVFGYLIIRSLEQVHFGLIRHVNYPAWIYSALLTALFALVINFIALRKVKHLRLRDIA